MRNVIASWKNFGGHSCFRSLKASQHIQQNLLMASRRSGIWPPSIP